MRVALAATLFSAPDLLLLDEPTNYLDLEGTLWLEDHLANYPRTVIVISHDRDLLDTSVDQILHLDRGKLTLYKGSYSSFEEQRATREMLDAKHAKRQADERKRLQAFVDRFKAKASKARQAQSRVKMLERMKPVTALVTQDVREITFPTPEKTLSPPIIAVDDVSVGYDPKKPVLNRVTLRIDTEDRIALLGSNGNGKSTLVKLLGQQAAAVLRPDHAGGQTLGRLFRAASGRRTQPRRLALRSRPQADARCAGIQGARPRRRDRVFRQGRRHPGQEPVGRREGAAVARARHLLRPEHDHPRRADQPSGHRQPRGAGRSDQRFSRRRHHGLARPLSDRSLRRSIVGRRQPDRDAYDGDLDDYRRMVLSIGDTRSGSRERGTQGDRKAGTRQERKRRR